VNTPDSFTFVKALALFKVFGITGFQGAIAKHYVLIVDFGIDCIQKGFEENYGG